MASSSQAKPRPTLADVEGLDAASDYRAFVARDVDPNVRNAAFKKLFHSDPHFNVMDGLDVYIDDYNTPNPLPVAIMRTLMQARELGLIDDELKEQDLPAPSTPSAAASPDATQGQTVEASEAGDPEGAEGGSDTSETPETPDTLDTPDTTDTPDAPDTPDARDSTEIPQAGASAPDRQEPGAGPRESATGLHAPVTAAIEEHPPVLAVSSTGNAATGAVILPFPVGKTTGR